MPGEHDHRGDGRQAEGDRQEHRDGRDRADAGQDADQRPEQDAHQAVEQVPPLERDAEAERKIIEELQVHRVLLEFSSERISQ